MAIEKIFIAGGGTMGRGIAQTCAQAGIRVILYDVSSEALNKAMEGISWSVGKLVEKGRIPGDTKEILGRIETSVSLDRAREADLVMEAVYEDLAIKGELLEKLSGVIAPDTLVATNTSAIPITELAVFVSDPAGFFGLHFFNPVPLMGAVEVIKGGLTSAETLEKGRRFARQIGKEPIMVHRDCPGFVINRINLPSSLEAMRVVEEGVASVEDVDKGVKLALGRRMGVFETGDIVGLDVTMAALMAIYEESKDSRWYPPMILRRKVKAGQLGLKSGRGWYEYDAEGRRQGPTEL